GGDGRVLLRHLYPGRPCHARRRARRALAAPRQDPFHLLGAARSTRTRRRQLQGTFLMTFVMQLYKFLQTRSKVWMLPIIFMTVAIGGVLILAHGSVIAPFIYTLF